MQFLTSRTVLYARAVFLVSTAFMAVHDPKTIFLSNFVMMLGQAMRLPAVVIDERNPFLGIVAVLLGIMALSDVIPLLADNIQYFESIVPIRLFAFFCLAAYACLVENPYFGNNLIFVYAFVEVWLNFLVYSNLRDEKYYRLKNYIEEHGEELQREEDEEVQVVE